MSIVARLMVELKSMGMSQRIIYESMRRIENDEERLTKREIREALKESGRTAAEWRAAAKPVAQPLLADVITDDFHPPRVVGRVVSHPAYMAELARQKDLEARGIFPGRQIADHDQIVLIGGHDEKFFKKGEVISYGTVDRLNRNYVAGHLLRLDQMYGSHTDLIRLLDARWTIFARGNYIPIGEGGLLKQPGSP